MSWLPLWCHERISVYLQMVLFFLCLNSDVTMKNLHYVKTLCLEVDVVSTLCYL